MRPLGLLGDRLGAGPAEAVAADADAVADRAVAGHHEVKEGVAGIDHDRAGRFAAAKGDDLALEFCGKLEALLGLLFYWRHLVGARRHEREAGGRGRSPT